MISIKKEVYEVIIRKFEKKYSFSLEKLERKIEEEIIPIDDQYC